MEMHEYLISVIGPCKLVLQYVLKSERDGCHLHIFIGTPFSFIRIANTHSK